MIFVSDRRAEQCHHAIAEELVDRALVTMDGAQDHLEGAVHDLVDLFWVQVRGHGREAGDVREEHGHLLALPFHRAPGREDLLSKVPGRVRLGRREQSTAARHSGLPPRRLSSWRGGGATDARGVAEGAAPTAARSRRTAAESSWRARRCCRSGTLA